MSYVDITFTSLQGLDILATQQKDRIERLATNLKELGYVEESPVESRPSVENVSVSDTVYVGHYSMTTSKCISFICDQGTFTADKFLCLDEDTKEIVMVNVSYFLLSLIDGISNVCNQRDKINAAVTSKLPPVTPHQWIRVSTYTLIDLIRTHRDRMEVVMNRETIRLIEEDHKCLKRCYANEDTLRMIIDNQSSGIGFSDSWDPMNGRFKYLLQLSGGLATVFPGTADVESDFSVLKYEKNYFRTSLLDITLEGIMHCKQYINIMEPN